MKISHFKLDRNKKILELNKELLEYINKFFDNKDIDNLFKKTSHKYRLSLDTIKFEGKQFLFKNFINGLGIFSQIFAFKNITIYFLKNFFFILYIFFTSRKKKEIRKCDLIIDNITRTSNVYNCLSLSNSSDVIYILGEDVNLETWRNLNLYLFKYKNLILERKLDFLITNFNLLILYTFFSIKTKNNLLTFFFHFIKKNYKYRSIFSEIKSKFILQERFYDTSAIRDEIFYQNNGKLTACLQRNLLQLNGLGMFIKSDIFFTLGKKSAEIISKTSSQIKKIIPIGSLLYENYFKEKNNLNNFESYDLLVFANEQNIGKNHFHSGYNNYYKEYYEHYNWIKRFALEHKNLKIGIKHRKVCRDKIELSIFKDIKNVYYIFDKDKNKSESYSYGHRAKALCTWSSTVGYEMIGSGRICYYLDPYNSNYAFLPKNEINDLIRITKYSDFKNKSLDLINGKFRDKIILERKDDYCLVSNNVSKKILDYFDL